jgi:hypothetical protein
MSKYRDQYVSGVPKDQFGPKPAESSVEREAEPVEEQSKPEIELDAEPAKVRFEPAKFRFEPVECYVDPETVQEPVEVQSEPEPEPEPQVELEPAKPEPKGAELPPVDRPSGMRARAQHHLDAYTAKLRRTPHGGPNIRTCEIVISICRDILGEEE